MKEKMQTEQAIKILENTYIIAARRSGKIENVKALALAINALRGKEERPTGEWIAIKPSYPFPFECSNCGHQNMHKPRYCSHCGARMKGAEE